MAQRYGQLLFCLLFFFCVSVPAAIGQEQSTEVGFVKLDDKGQELSANAEQWAMVRAFLKPNPLSTCAECRYFEAGWTGRRKRQWLKI